MTKSNPKKKVVKDSRWNCWECDKNFDAAPYNFPKCPHCGSPRTRRTSREAK